MSIFSTVVSASLSLALVLPLGGPAVTMNTNKEAVPLDDGIELEEEEVDVSSLILKDEENFQKMETMMFEGGEDLADDDENTIFLDEFDFEPHEYYPGVEPFMDPFEDEDDSEPGISTFLVSTMRSILTALGGERSIQIVEAQVVCGMSNAVGCASREKIAIASKVRGYSSAWKWYLMAHEYAHVVHFRQWDQVNNHSTYKSAFRSNPEHLADCMASVKGRRVSGKGYSCTNPQLNFARAVWNHNFVAKPNPPTPKPPVVNYTTVQAPWSYFRTHGATRYETSINIARSYWTDGPVFITTGANYPDALSAGPAAAKTNGNLLLSKKEISNDTLSLVKNQKAKQIYIIGGTSIISEASKRKLEAIAPVERIAGKNRYETSRMIAEKFFPDAKTVYIATGANYPDALSASAVSGSKGLPVLLIHDSHINNVKNTMQKIGVTHFHVAGGKSVVSTKAFNALSTVAKGTRSDGKNRYDTSRLLNTRMNNYTGVSLLATGANYPDALSGAAAAGKAGHTLYLSNKNCIPKTTYSAMKEKTSQVRLVGGPSVIDVGNTKVTRVCK